MATSTLEPAVRTADTFPINGELEMLQCRLEEMSEAVDFMVAVEADVDHQDHPKPYHITENLDRFAAWSDQLVVVRASGLPTNTDDPDPWARELAQREHALRGLHIIDSQYTKLHADTIILHGDVDEICRPLHVKNVRPGRVNEGDALISFEQRMHCFAVDWLHPDPWGGTVAGTIEIRAAAQDVQESLRSDVARSRRPATPATGTRRSPTRGGICHGWAGNVRHSTSWGRSVTRRLASGYCAV